MFFLEKLFKPSRQLTDVDSQLNVENSGDSMNGTIMFRPAANASGTSVFRITLVDSGGTGVSWKPTLSFAPCHGAVLPGYV
jgi:hypothetical protein